MTDLAEIHRRYLNMIHRVCSRYSSDAQEAEDLVQEVFLAIQKGLASFRGDSQLGTWIYRLATNRCLEHLRVKRRRKELDVRYLDSLVVRNLTGCDNRVLAKVDLERILAHIRAEARQILFLSLAEGLTYRETAEALGVSKEAVAKTVARFLKRFADRRARLATPAPGPQVETRREGMLQAWIL
jgi:RNA polymerase sigma factor (sigma-70 family)